MQLIHHEMLESWPPQSGPSSRDIKDLRERVLASEYVRFGVYPGLVVDTRQALMDLATHERSDDVSATEAFARVVSVVGKSAKVKRAMRHLQLLGLAHRYGVRFASAAEVPKVLDAIAVGLCPLVKGADKELARDRLWNKTGDLLAMIGAHQRCDPLCGVSALEIDMDPVLDGGLTGDVVQTLLILMSALRQPIPLCKLLALSALAHRVDLNPLALAKLIELVPGRVDDIIQLLNAQMLDNDSCEAFAVDPRVLQALSQPAVALFTIGLLGRTKGQTILDVAHAHGSALVEANADHRLFRELVDEQRLVHLVKSEPKPEVPAPEPKSEPISESAPVAVRHFDHTRLVIDEYVPSKVRLVAVQVWLVFGVLQPDVSVSTMFNSSWRKKNDVIRMCTPHFKRLNVSASAQSRAWQFLADNMLFAGQKRNRTVRFTREGRRATAVGIIQAMDALNAQIDRP